MTATTPTPRPTSTPTPREIHGRATGVQSTLMPTPPPWRVAGLWPPGGRVLVTVDRRDSTGTDGLLGTLLRALVTGEPWLGAEVARCERVVLLGGRGLLRRWLWEGGPIPPRCAARADSLHLQPSTDLADPATRTRRARALDGADVVVVADLPPGVDLDGLAGLLDLAGVREALVVREDGDERDTDAGATTFAGTRSFAGTRWRLAGDAARDDAAPGVRPSLLLSASGPGVDLAGLALDVLPGVALVRHDDDHDDHDDHDEERRSA